MSDLENILDGVEPDPNPAPEEPKAEAETPEPEAKAESEEPTTPDEPEKQDDNAEPKSIPYPVFKSTREDLKGQLDEARRELDYLRRSQRDAAQEKPNVPDVLEDQDAFSQHIMDTVNQVATGQKLQMSRFFAEREFGKDQVQEAVEYFNQHPEASHRFLSEASPFHAAVEYVRQQKVAREVGADPSAYRAKLESEIRAKIQAEMAAKQATEMAQKSVPSMAKTNGGGGITGPEWQGPADLENLIGE